MITKHYFFPHPNEGDLSTYKKITQKHKYFMEKFRLHDTFPKLEKSTYIVVIRDNNLVCDVAWITGWTNSGIFFQITLTLEEIESVRLNNINKPCIEIGYITYSGIREQDQCSKKRFLLCGDSCFYKGIAVERRIFGSCVCNYTDDIVKCMSTLFHSNIVDLIMDFLLEPLFYIHENVDDCLFFMKYGEYYISGYDLHLDLYSEYLQMRKTRS